MIASLVVASLVGCDEMNAKAQERNERGADAWAEKMKDTSISNINRNLHTVEYEGHRFIVLTGTRRGAMVHHPDCGCK